MNVVLRLLPCRDGSHTVFVQTRALTMAQFLEMRYSKKFRTYAGIVAFVSGYS